MAPYCYNQLFFRKKDHVNYEHMLILLISHSREVCATMEQALIVHCQEHYGRRCANRKNDKDNNNNNKDSNSEDERSEGPHIVYCVVGKPMW